MHVSSKSEARQGFFAAMIALPGTLLALGGTLAFAAAIV